jgi:hypothetical protein
VKRGSLSIPLSVGVIAFAVVLSFLPCLKAGFLNWDDDINILENTTVRSLDPANIGRIFTQSVQKIYIPLTTLSYAVEYHFVGYRPFLFHATNLVLHVLNTLLVFLIAGRLGLTAGGALWAALLFGVHPMKVESVAWVTERKDVLYAFFYLAAMFNYLVYLKNDSKRRYAVSIAAGLLSILSKPMALSLPLILFLLDWFCKRPASKNSWADKVPFFLMIVPVTWITYSQHVRNPVADLGQAVLVWIWTFVFYIWKFIAPLVLIPLYRMPDPVSLAQAPFVVSLLVFILMIASVSVFRHSRWWLLAVGYYVFSIFFLLRFDVGVDLNVVADRFMYLPCLGFCLAAGYGLTRIAQGGVPWRIYAGAAIVIVLLMAKTFTQSQIWQTPTALWSYVIAKDPHSHVGYNNRGNIYNEADQLNEAMADYQKALEINPKFARAFNNRGIIYAKAGRNREALADFNKAVEFKPDFEKAYYNRAVIEERLGEFRAAFDDAKRAGDLRAPVPADFFNRLENEIKNLP